MATSRTSAFPSRKANRSAGAPISSSIWPSAREWFACELNHHDIGIYHAQKKSRDFKRKQMTLR
jgi:hypothetical protein